MKKKTQCFFVNSTRWVIRVLAKFAVTKYMSRNYALKQPSARIEIWSLSRCSVINIRRCPSLRYVARLQVFPLNIAVTALGKCSAPNANTSNQEASCPQYVPHWGIQSKVLQLSGPTPKARLQHFKYAQ